MRDRPSTRGSEGVHHCNCSFSYRAPGVMISPGQTSRSVTPSLHPTHSRELERSSRRARYPAQSFGLPHRDQRPISRSLLVGALPGVRVGPVPGAPERHIGARRTVRFSGGVCTSVRLLGDKRAPSLRFDVWPHPLRITGGRSARAATPEGSATPSTSRATPARRPCDGQWP